MSGRALVIDLLSHMRSEEAALMFEAAGLTTTRVFGTDQLTNACGYLAAMWAVMVHSLGTAFSSLTLDMARQANTLNMIELMNNNLGFHELGTAARWLTDDEILSLVTTHNPDGYGTSPRWFSGPGPYNLFQRHFERSCRAPDPSRVHIYAVNSESQTEMTAAHGGLHWFLAAWIVEPTSGSEPATNETTGVSAACKAGGAGGA